MSRRQKLAVIAVMSFGFSSVLVSAFRFIILGQLGSNPDTSFVLGKMVIVAALEIQLAVVAVSLPSVKALWTRLTGGSSAGSKDRNGGQYINSKGYALSSIDRPSNKGHGSAQGTSRSVAVKPALTGHSGSIISESEEDLWKASQAGTITITKDVSIESSMAASGDGDDTKEGYNLFGLPHDH